MNASDSNPNQPKACATFATTHWSVVLAAGDTASPIADEALAKLCRAYWYPLYAFLRQQGHAPHDAQDLTQGYFALFLEKHFLKDVAREKGRFRSFLLASLKHFLANEWDRSQAVRRGGDCTIVSWDEQGVERRFHSEPACEDTPDKNFDRRWAITLLDKTVERLRQEYANSGKTAVYETLQECLSAPTARQSYAPAAAKLNLSEGAVKVAVHRLRRRYGQLLREEIAHTVSGVTDIDEELRYLFSVLGGQR